MVSCVRIDKLGLMLEQFSSICFKLTILCWSLVMPLGLTKVTNCLMGTSAKERVWTVFHGECLSVCMVEDAVL